MHGSKSSQMVILPSRVRRIPFTVPGLHNQDEDGEQSPPGDAPAAASAVKWRSEPNLDGDVITQRRVIGSNLNMDSIGSLDPSLYVLDGSCSDFADEHFDDDNIGRVWFSLDYNPDTERLIVKLIQVKNLQSRVAGSANSCDPFVRVSLMPDERRWTQSASKRKTCNPYFDESFVFQVSHKDLEERAVKLTVYDIDRYRRHVVLGHVVYPLKGHATDEHVVIWRDLERQLPHSGLALREASELQLSLCYNDILERLSVGVFSGRNFHVPELLSEHSSPAKLSFYIKIGLTRPKHEPKKKRTATMKANLQQNQQPQQQEFSINANFNESFAFKLPASMTDTARLTLCAMQSRRATRRDKPVGRVVLGSFMIARGPELDHWTQMLASPKQQICRWHKLS